MRRREFIGLFSAAAAWPLAVRAQIVGRPARLAVVNLAVPTTQITRDGSPPYRAFFEELQRLGYYDRNIKVEPWSGEGQVERYPDLAKQVVATRPDIIFASSARFLKMLKGETSEIPIVGITSDPVGYGLAHSLARPGSNMTGVTTDAGLEVIAKHLELLKDVTPNMRRVASLSPRSLWDSPNGKALQVGAHDLGCSVVPLAIEGSFDEAAYRKFFTEAEHAQADALLVPDIPENTSNRKLIVELAEKHRIRTLYPHAEYTKIGGLMSYGYDILDLYRRVASYVDAILKGSKAGDLPFFQPTRLYLIVNLKTAKALNLEIPRTVLARADDVIE